MKILKISLFISITIHLSFSIIHNLSAQPTTIEVSGDITTDTTWIADTVKVTGSVTVLDNVTLTINPGAYVEFQGWYYLRIHGRLLAEGRENDTIVFTINDTTGFSNVEVDSGAWNRIWFDGISSNNDTSKLICCRIEYSKATTPDKNLPESQGGGIYIDSDSKVLVSHCNIYNNIAKGIAGGIRIWDTDVILTHNLIHYNKGFWGGGVNMDGGSAIISNNIITKNVSLWDGSGGITVGYGSAIISNNIIFENNTYSGGGGIHTSFSRAIIYNNIISNNHSGTAGGLSSGRSANIITGNLIVNNRADGGAGGCTFDASTPVFHNNIVCNNINFSGDGGIHFTNFISGDFMNNIIWGNVCDGIPLQIWIQNPSSNPSFYNCIIQDGTAGFHFQPGTPYLGDTINILDLNPDFINPTTGPGLNFDGLSANWDIKNTSPCINQGTNEAIGVLPSETDIAGNQRVIHGQIDIGAYEKRINKFQVSGIISADTIWIADTIEINGDIKVEDNITLTIAPGTYLEFQDYYKMDIEGTLLAVGTEKNPISFTIDDTKGFTNKSITDGAWRGIFFDNSWDGANGIMSDNDTSKIVNCILEYAKDFDSLYLQGGAIKANFFSNLVIKNCTIRYNSAYSGGGIGLMDGSNPLIEGNVIYNNSVKWNGGGIACDVKSNAKIINNIISNNYTRNTHPYQHIGGGGIACFSSDPVIQNNVICNNESYTFGGGIILNDSYPLFANNTVCNNKDHLGYSGAGMNTQACNPKIYNTIFAGNVSETENIQVGGWEHPDLYYCNIQGIGQGMNFWSDYYGDSISLHGYDPQFISPSQGAGIEYDGLSANWALTDFSPDINAGIPDLSGLNLPATDIAGNARINYGIVDIGAYESQADPLEIIQQPVNMSACVGDSISFKIKVKGSVHYQWYKNQEPIAGEIDPVLTINPVTLNDEANYNCIVENGYGSKSSNNVFLNVKTHPRILIEPESRWIDPNKPLKLQVIVDGTSPLSYQWIKDGLELSQANLPEYSLSDISYTNEGTYSCIISNVCGQITTNPATLYLAPQICMVTVDPMTGNNLVVWEKNSIAPILYYNIYRESSYAGLYDDPIASVSYDLLSIYNDTDTLVDPTKRAYLYKITAVDTSGYETDLELCKTHKTIHLLITTNPETNATQLDWDRYVGFDYGTYEIFRSDTTINFSSIDAMSSSSSTWADPNPGTETKYYRVAAIKPDSCYPSGIAGNKAETGPYSHSMSNMEDNRLQTGIFEPLLINETLRIYPNPFNGTTTLSFHNPEGLSYTLYIMDLSGKTVRMVDDITTSEFILEKENLKEGFYFIELRGPETYRGKVIIE